ncbi:MAG: four helix bundle protein [Candidatus Sungiibacteriota bacterium]|uniref:Four helix bundle protein n=1 Tax=Candidatus Sungiibacteriota bacterium TaxID=2750080 RepID=A0A7T5RJ41_9BACT|nr:MAG: four helix bundle protein [Candidatus Sungbacteria bacterium]
MNEKIRDFKDLYAWQEAHKLVVMVYKITEKFPKSEVFGLTNQMRRSAISVTSNIAEGFGRQGYKEKVQFYYLAQGSLIELKNQLIAAKDVGYLTDKDFAGLVEQANLAHKILQGLITKSKHLLNHDS